MSQIIGSVVSFSVLGASGVLRSINRGVGLFCWQLLIIKNIEITKYCLDLVSLYPKGFIPFNGTTNVYINICTNSLTSYVRSTQYTFPMCVGLPCDVTEFVFVCGFRIIVMFKHLKTIGPFSNTLIPTCIWSQLHSTTPICISYSFI